MCIRDSLKSGRVLTGLQKYKGRLYYGTSKGLYTGWKTISGKKYYFRKAGYAATGKLVISGKSYTFSSSGILVKSPSEKSVVPEPPKETEKPSIPDTEPPKETEKPSVCLLYTSRFVWLMMKRWKRQRRVSDATEFLFPELQFREQELRSV